MSQSSIETAPTDGTTIGSAPRLQAIAIAFLLLALVPLFGKLGAQSYILSFATRALIFAIAAMSLDLILGYGNLISFGHAAFVGIGSYAVGMLASHGFNDLAVQVPAALIAAMLFAAATSYVSLRTSGVYYIMSTLAFGQMLFFLAVSLSAYGGDDGMTLQGRSTVFGLPLLKGDVAFYYVTLVILGGLYALARAIVASRFGRVLAGIRENPERMRAIGFDPFLYQLTACIIAGAICAVAGVLLANQAEFVSPAYMSWQRSGELLVIVVLGGIGTLHGAIIGAISFLVLEEALSRVMEHWKLVFGPMLVLVAMFGRGGITGLIEFVIRRFSRGGSA